MVNTKTLAEKKKGRNRRSTTPPGDPNDPNQPGGSNMARAANPPVEANPPIEANPPVEANPLIEANPPVEANPPAQANPIRPNILPFGDNFNFRMIDDSPADESLVMRHSRRPSSNLTRSKSVPALFVPDRDVQVERPIRPNTLPISHLNYMMREYRVIDWELVPQEIHRHLSVPSGLRLSLSEEEFAYRQIHPFFPCLMYFFALVCECCHCISRNTSESADDPFLTHTRKRD